MASSTSRRPSPKKLIASTNRVIASPGNSQIHHWFVTTDTDFAAFKMLPQVGVVSATPRPMKERDAYWRMKKATFVVVDTMIGLITLGRICLNMMLFLLIPKASQTFT